MSRAPLHARTSTAACLAVLCMVAAAAAQDMAPQSYETYRAGKRTYRQQQDIVDPTPVRAGKLGRTVEVPQGWHRGLRPPGERLETGVAVVDGKTAVVEVTVPSGVRGRLYYGVYVPDRPVRTPAYLAEAEAEVKAFEARDRLRFKLDLAHLSHVRHDVGGLRRARGGTVAFRIVLATSGGERIHDGRFACHRGQRVPAVCDGPWLDQLTGNSAVLWFRTDLPALARITVGEREFTSSKKQTRHVFRVAGLQPGKAYRYAVSPHEGVVLDGLRFTTPAFQEINFDFAYLASSASTLGGGERSAGGVNRLILRRACLEAYNRGARFVVFGGGFAAVNGTPADFARGLAAWKAAVEPVGALVPVYEVMGGAMVANQVVGPSRGTKAFLRDGAGDESSEAIFAAAFENPARRHPYPEVKEAPSYRENVYHFDHNNVRVVVLNTAYWRCSEPEKNGGNLQGFLMTRQFIWVQEVLNDALIDDAVDHVFLVGHDPAFPNGGAVFRGPWWNGGKVGWGGGKGEDRHYAVERRDEFWRAVTRNPKVVALVFGGEPNYSRTRIDKDVDPSFKHPVWQITSGGAGAPLRARANWVPWSRKVEAFAACHHFCLFKVRGTRVGLVVYSDTGQVIDRVWLR